MYGLHAGDGVIRYVGQTRTGIYQRLASHRAYARRNEYGPAVYVWMRKHGDMNIEAIVLAIPANHEEMNQREREEIAKRWTSGLLTNHEKGGLHGAPHPGAWASRPMICRKGLHGMLDDNIVYDARGGRRCRACRKEAERIRGERRTAERVRVRDVPGYVDPRSILNVQQQSEVRRMSEEGKSGAAIARELDVQVHVVRALLTKGRPRTKVKHITEAQVLEIRALREQGETLLSISQKHGVGLSQVHRICSGKSWVYVGGKVQK